MTGCSYGCKLEKISFYSYLTNQGSSATVGKTNIDVSANGSKRIGANCIKRCEDSP